MFFKRVYIGQTDFYAVYYDRIEGLPYCAEKSSALEKGYRGVRSPVYYLLSLLFLFFVITGFGKTPITGWLSVLFHNVFFKVFFLAFFIIVSLLIAKNLLKRYYQNINHSFLCYETDFRNAISESIYFYLIKDHRLRKC